MKKKMLTFLLTACMTVGCYAPAVRADNSTPAAGSGKIEVSEENGSGKDILAKMEAETATKPEGFDNDTLSPYGTAVGEAFPILENMELFQLESYNVNSSKASDRSVKTGYGEGASGKANVNIPMTSSVLGPDDMLSFTQGVSFDPTNSGRRSYIGLVGYDGPNHTVKLHIIDAKNNRKVQTIDVASGSGIKWLDEAQKDKKNAKGVDLVDSKNFFQITAGDYDGDGKDSLIIWCGNITDHSRNGLVEVTYDGQNVSKKDIPAAGILNQTYLSNGMYNDNPKDIGSRLGVSLASGDVNGDGIDDLVAVSSAGRLETAKYDGSKGASRWAYLSASFGQKEKEFGEFSRTGMTIEQKTGRENESHYAEYRTLLYAGVAIGDIDGDGKNEIATAGFLNYRYYYQNPLNYQKDKAAFASYSCRGNKLYLDGDIIELSGENLSAISKGDSIRTDPKEAESAIWQQFSVECAAFDGVNTQEYLFLNGYIYKFEYNSQLQKTTLSKKYDAYFNTLKRNADGIGDVNENFVYSTAVGNFFNDEKNGTEAITVMVGYKENDDDDYTFYRETLKKEGNNFQLGDDDWIIADRGDTYQERLNCITVAVDIDTDSVVGKYRGKNFAYTDPNVVAFLQAAPYFSELGAENSATTYSYAENYTITTTRGTETSYNVGVTSEVSAGPVSASLSGGAAFELSEEYSNSRSQEYTTTFEANDQNQVILRRTLLYFYYYDLMQDDGTFKGDSNEKDTSNSLVVSVPQYPVMSSLSMDQYDEFADAFNSKYGNAPGTKIAEGDSTERGKGQSSAYQLTSLESLKGQYYLNNEGNPFNYAYSDAKVANVRNLAGNQWMNLSHAGGTTQLAYTSTVEEAYTKTQSDGLYMNMSVSVGYDGLFVSASVGIEAGFEKLWSSGISTSSMKSVGSGGSVQNLSSDDQDYKFSWTLIGWKPTEGSFKDVPFIGYAVRNVFAPAEPVEDLSAAYQRDNGNVSQGTVTLTWTAPDASQQRNKITRFEIYKLGSNGYTKAGEIENNNSEEYSFKMTVDASEKEATYVVRSIGPSGTSHDSNEAKCLFAVSAEEVQAMLSEALGNLDVSIEQLKKADTANAAELKKAVSDLTKAYQTADVLLKDDLDQRFSGEIEKLQTAMNEAQEAFQQKIEGVQSNLDQAVAELKASIASGDQINAEAIEAVNQSVGDVKMAYEQADGILREALEAGLKNLTTETTNLQTSMNEANKSLQDAINQVQANLDRAVEELNKSIAAGDKAAQEALEKSEAESKAVQEALEKSTEENKAKAEELQKIADELKAALNELTAKHEAFEKQIQETAQKEKEKAAQEQKEAEEKARREAEAKAQQEAAEKARQEAEAKTQREAAEKAQREAQQAAAQKPSAQVTTTSGGTRPNTQGSSQTSATQNPAMTQQEQASQAKPDSRKENTAPAQSDKPKTETQTAAKPNAPQTASPQTKTGTSAKKTVMHRLYNPNTGEHFYTSNSAEQALLVKAGWKAEGVGWHAPENSSRPVYRLYNPNSGDHHYTTSAGEKNVLVKLGWKDEGIGWYSAEADEGAPVYRLYNPNARTGAHHYTLNKAERDLLVKAGWRNEGVGWYS